jgi:cyclic pyranopterin phosphate synthase
MPEEKYGPSHVFASRAEILRFEEIARLCRVAVFELGVRKIRLTGGEPLLRRDLPRLAAMLAAIDGLEDLALTTNGTLLATHARALREAGLQRVTVSLDALDDETFARLSGGRGSVRQVLERIEAAVAVGFSPIKINCVVQRGVNEHAVSDLAARFRHSGIVVRFIELMDVGTVNGWSLEQVVPASEILERIATVSALSPIEAAPGAVAERYRYDDGSGEVGVIASVSRPFCGGCNRARLSADGQLLTCLFAERGLDLRAPLRDGASDERLAARMLETWRAREDRYSELRAEHRAQGKQPRRLQMFQVGG